MESVKVRRLSLKHLDYYVDMITFTKNIKFYDEDGIPVTFFYYTGKKIYAHPTTIAQWGLASIQKYLRTHQIRHLANFKKACEWLVKNGLQQDGALLFPLNFDHPAYYLKKPWCSAMTQGEAISLLVRGFLYFKENKYLKDAELEKTGSCMLEKT